MSAQVIKTVFMFVLSLLLATMSADAEDMDRRTYFNLSQGTAIQGYDPVAYFKDNQAVKGRADTATVYQGVEYRFSSEDNKNLFLMRPEDYEPQYGGWCAYAMGASGEKVQIDPKTFKIVDGKLYLFYNAFFNNTLKSWNKDEDNLKAKADENWAHIGR